MKTKTFSAKIRDGCRAPQLTVEAYGTASPASRLQIRQILRGSALQPKLVVGAPDDVYEQEADRVAEQVMRMPEPAVQRESELEEEEELLQPKALSDQGSPAVQRQALPEEEEELIQPKAAESVSEVPPSLTEDLARIKGGGQPLDPQSRAYFEPRFGVDFGAVRIHADASAAAAAQALRAQAFTLGRHIVFGEGRYGPDSAPGKRLLAHELTHVLQQAPLVKTLQRTPDVDDPSRSTQVHEALFISTPSGGTLRAWVNPDPANGVAGTAEDIKNQFIAALRSYISANPLSVGGTVPTRTTESQAETTAIAVDQDIRTTFPQITTPLPESRIRDIVGIIQPSQTSDSQFLNQWLENRLSLMTDIDEFNIRASDPRYQQMLADILADDWAGPNVETLASRQAAFIDTGTRIYLHRGAPADLRRLILIHELTHFYTDQGFRDWVDATTAPRFYNEGFTEYLARMVMTPDESSNRNNYEANVQAIRDKVVAFVPEDDIARAYFLGEVWRLEANSDVARQLFESQIGMREGAPRSTEVAESQSSHGIVQTVEAESRYRFMNLAINQTAPKPEHVAFFEEIRQRYLGGRPEMKIRFVGHADETGGARHNMELSRRRAEAFYQMARDAGVPDSQLLDAATPPHRGEAEPTSVNTSIYGRALNRRVELYLVRNVGTGTAP